MSKQTGLSPGAAGSQIGWASTSTMLGGIVVWGGAGWLLDHWLGTRFATPTGALLGMALGIYAVVARYGRAPVEPTQRATDPANGSQPDSVER